MFEVFADAPTETLAIGGVVALILLIGVLKFVGQVVYVLLTGHVPQNRRAYGHGGCVEAETPGPVGRWLFGGDNAKEDGGGWFGWGDADGDGGGDGGGGD